MSRRIPRIFSEAEQEVLLQYTYELFIDERSEQANILDIQAEREMPSISLSPEEGHLVYVLLKMIQAVNVVEIGTLAGYSASWIARALPDHGKLITLEGNEHHAGVAKETLKQAGYGDKVEVRVGFAKDTLQTLTDTYDAVLIDADKLNYPIYLEWALAHIRIGGLIMAHNAYLQGDIIKNTDEVEEMRVTALTGMQTFNNTIAENDQLTTTILPLGDGLLVALVGK